MNLYTPFGETQSASRAQIEETLDALQQAGDADMFVGIQRPDGTFLQMQRLPIEYGDGSGRTRRASLPPDVRRMFLAFAAGETDWDRGFTWVEDEAPRGLGRKVPLWGVVVAFLALAIAAAGYVWWKAR
jgi:hypothetical protein